jgi:hypothetical protein
MVIMVVLAIGAVVAGWLLVVSPKRGEASSLSTQISSVQSQLDTVRSQVAAGEAARTAFAGQYAQLAKLGEAVPPDDQVPSLIYQVQSAAQAAHVSFRGLQLTAPSGGSSSSSSSSSKPGAGAAISTPGQLPPGAAVGAAGLPTEQFSFTLGGNFFHLADFFNRLENFVVSRDNRLLISGRLMTINAINLAPGATGFPQITATVSATTYIVPATQGPLGGATPAGPATAPRANASTPGSSTGAPAAAITPVLR